MSILDEYEIICPDCGNRRLAREWESTGKYFTNLEEFLNYNEHYVSINFICPDQERWVDLKFPKDFIKIDDTKYFFIEHEVV